MLVVEDDSLVSEMVQGMVEEIGYTVIGTAGDGQTAVAMAQRLRPDVVLMDLGLPDMDGIEAARRIHQCCPTPVVVVTAHDTPELVRQAGGAGVGAYLIKPPRARDMERAITIAMARFSDMMELQRLNVQLQAKIAEHEQAEAALRQRNRDLKLLNQLGRDLSATLELPQVIEQVLQAAQQVVPASGSSVWLWDEEQPGWLVCQAAYHPGLTGKLLSLRLRPGEGIAGWVAQHGETALVPCTASDARFSARIDVQIGFQTKSMLAVPLRVRDQVIGVLEVVNREDGHFDTRDGEMMEILAASVATAIQNARLHDHALQAAAAAERNRLARELHDAVNQTIFSASVIAESLPRLWERDPEEVRRGLEQLHSLTQGALAEMRTLLLELRPAALLETDLGALLRQLARAVSSLSHVEIVVNTNGRHLLPPEVQIALYRITQEALNNVTKHSRATRAEIAFDNQPGRVELRISDNGRGFDGSNVPPSSMGLHIVRERAQSIGAALEISSQAGQGTQILVTWCDTPAGPSGASATGNEA